MELLYPPFQMYFAVEPVIYDHSLVFVIIFPATYDGKIQWSTSGIENVADFCHFVT